jgi:hypothetical protein
VLGFLPTLHDDELLYSVVARHWSLLGGGPIPTYVKEMFGTSNATLRIAYPIELSKFIEQLPDEGVLSIEQIIRDHSLLPYLVAFATPETSKALQNRMAVGPKGIPPRIGALSMLMPSNFQLKACKECVSQDTSRHGEPFWRSSHQLPGVWVCPYHQSSLVTTSVVRLIPRGRLLPMPLGPKLLSDAAPIESQSHLRPALVRIAEQSSVLLRCGLAGRDIGHLQSTLREMLAQGGFAWKRAPSLIHTQELSEKFASNPVARVFLDRGGPWTAEQVYVGLNRILYAKRYAKYPLAVLLLLELIGASLDDLNNWQSPTRESRKDEGTPRQTMPCANPVCVEFVSFASRRLVELNLPKGRHRVTCPICGFTYSWSSETPNKLIVLATGVKWDIALRAALREPTGSLRKIAKSLGVAVKTLQRHARRLGLWNESWIDSRKLHLRRADRINRAMSGHRSVWLRYRTAFPNAIEKMLEPGVRTAYRFLCRYDPAWLSENMPLGPPGPRKRHIDWAARDRDLVVKLDQILTSSHNFVGLGRKMTASDIGLALRAPWSIVHYRSQLPLLWKRILEYL